MIALITNALSAAAAFLAAILWFRSTRDEIPVDPEDQEMTLISEKRGGRKIDILKTAERQTWWNKWAALAAGVAALFQAVALAVSIISN